MITAATELGAETLTEAFEYLDDLRQSGETNMYGAPAYVERDLLLGRREASSVTKFWMDTFSLDESVERRVAKALAGTSD